MVYIIRRRRLGKTSTKNISALSKYDIPVILNDTDEQPDGHEICIRWGCTSNIKAPRTVNSAKAIHRVNNKKDFRLYLQAEGVSVPRTYSNLHDVQAYGIPPFIVRPRHHAQGRQLWVCNTYRETVKATQRAGEGWYASEIVNKTHEYRIFVMQGMVVCVAEKTPGNPDDIAWNVAKGGRFDNVRWDKWPIKACKLAIQAFDLSRLDFSGVDIMLDKEGAYVVELNSAPSLTSPYRQACMASGLDFKLDHMDEKLKVGHGDGWRDVIHPAIHKRKEL